MATALLIVHGCLAGMLAQLPADCAPQPTAYNQPAGDSPARHQQAGWPKCVAWWAIPSDTGAYCGYLVGGGCPYHCVADAPTTAEGTWGWDYVGRWFQRNVNLGWWHDRREGGGTYQTEGPRLLHRDGPQ